VHVDVRFVASTNRCLQQMVREGRFRADLYHRLNIARIEMPPLRNRPDDIELLLAYYNELFSAEYNRPMVQFSQGLRRVMLNYDWPGNVRELAAYVERLYATDVVPLPPGQWSWDDGYARRQPMVPPAPGRMAGPDDPGGVDEPQTAPQETDEPIECFSLAEVERQAIERALRHANWNRSLAAKLLTIHRSTLIRKIRRFGIERP
jgi:DNA-binding NtrC family response regulator